MVEHLSASHCINRHDNEPELDKASKQKMHFDSGSVLKHPTVHLIVLLAFSTVSALQPAILPPSNRLKEAVSPNAELASNEGNDWLNHGLLLSSFSDGLKPNPDALDFLMRGLVAALWREHQLAAEVMVEESAMHSPCCGPDLDALTSMELADASIAELEGGKVPWKRMLHSLSESCEDPLQLRFMYIPTAMYALRRDSQSTPGKQRQRAKADAKKRRNEIVDLLSSQLGDAVSIRTVTMDLDNGTINQPEGSGDLRAFPKVSSKGHFRGGRVFVYRY